MKVLRILFFTVLLLSCGFWLQAQDFEFPPDSTTVQVPYYNIFTLLSMPDNNGNVVKLHQSNLISQLVDSYIVRNYSKKSPGFRVRIFSDNSQTARQRIYEVEAAFRELYPNVPTYASYQDLYFKVTVGDFRTRTDAMRFLNSIQRNYPGAFIVKENINFPSL
ncbi:MAG: hypothetical protein FWH23_05525 [Bacteroidales bacterium]|nr:hypothetical protein [Bacteroidales bacterium]MCL2132898.1 hypothetical protein [Bacteroidales bacterium]